MREAQFQGGNCFGILGLGKAFELFMRRIKLSELSSRKVLRLAQLSKSK